MSRDVQSEINDIVKAHKVVLFMKGSRMMPQCGFSAQAVQILSAHTSDFETVNVLADMEIRQGVKDYASWPTVPQLYVKGEFVGGCDIVREMYQTGELAELMHTHGIEAKPAA